MKHMNMSVCGIRFGALSLCSVMRRCLVLPLGLFQPRLVARFAILGPSLEIAVAGPPSATAFLSGGQSPGLDHLKFQRPRDATVRPLASRRWRARAPNYGARVRICRHKRPTRAGA